MAKRIDPSKLGQKKAKALKGPKEIAGVVGVLGIDSPHEHAVSPLPVEKRQKVPQSKKTEEHHKETSTSTSKQKLQAEVVTLKKELRKARKKEAQPAQVSLVQTDSMSLEMFKSQFEHVYQRLMAHPKAATWSSSFVPDAEFVAFAKEATKGL